MLGAAAVLIVAGLLAAGVVAARRTDTTPVRAARPTTSAPTAQGAPAPLDGTYRLDVRRTQQTFNHTPDPQPPDVDTWWAFRSSCAPGWCAAVGVPLDDADHTRPKSPGGAPVVLEFREGRWLSRPEQSTFPCVGLDGVAGVQATTQVLSLRPQPHGELAGDMTVTVHSNECGQQGGVLRAPAVATRSGEVPTGMTVPDPAALPAAPEPPATAPSGPHR